MRPNTKHLNIVTFVGDQILLGKWQAGQRVPSVRELAIGLKVHTNTVMHSYKFLQEWEIIFKKRGLAYLLARMHMTK